MPLQSFDILKDNLPVDRRDGGMRYWTARNLLAFFRKDRERLEYVFRKLNARIRLDGESCILRNRGQIDKAMETDDGS